MEFKLTILPKTIGESIKFLTRPYKDGSGILNIGDVVMIEGVDFLCGADSKNQIGEIFFERINYKYELTVHKKGCFGNVCILNKTLFSRLKKHTL